MYSPMNRIDLDPPEVPLSNTLGTPYTLYPKGLYIISNAPLKSEPSVPPVPKAIA